MYQLIVECDGSADALTFLHEHAEWKPRAYVWVGDDIDNLESGYWEEVTADEVERNWDDECAQADWEAAVCDWQLTGGY